MEIRLLTCTPNPLKIIAAQQLIRKGDDISDINSISDEQAEKLFKDIMTTRLRGSLEFADFVFLIRGVTRAFTHQLVRHRTGVSFSQESLRFTDKTGFSFYTGPTIKKDSEAQGIYRWGMAAIQDTYKRLIDKGISVEDARGILPTNVETQISAKFNYRVLYDMAEVRLCTQTQKEFRDVVVAIKDEISKISPVMAHELQPVCVHTKHCEFASMFDRKCDLQEKYPPK